MDSKQKQQLAHTGSLDAAASAIRLRAARMAAGLSQKQLAKALGMPRTTNISNMERALSFPNREIMSFLWREHRIDFNFLMSGSYAQLPGDVQDRLFAALEVANSEWDQKEGSGRDPASPRPPQPQT